MDDEILEYFDLTSFPNHQATYWPSSEAFQLDISATPWWPLSAFDASVATAGSNQDPRNLDNHGFPVDTPSAAMQNDKASTRSPLDDVRTSTVASATRSSAYATEEDWTRHRALMRKIYVDEKRTLPDLMRSMESQHKFRATKKMYKSHITKWGLDKKNKENEMRAIVRKRKLRTDQGKRSIIRVRGRALSFAEVARYWHRKGVSIDDVVARRAVSKTPKAVEIVTPIPSPVLPPQELAIPEQMFRSIQDYIAGSFEAGTWVRTDPRKHCCGTKRSPSTNHGFTQGFHLACELFSKQHFQEGGRELLAATTKLEKVVLAESPHTLSGLCVIISGLYWWRKDEIALAILRHVSTLSEVLLAGKHPLRHMCACLSSIASSQFEDFIYRYTRSIADQFESHLGSMHKSTVYYRLGLIDMGGGSHQNMLQDLLDKCETNLGLYDDQSFLVRGRLISHHRATGNYVKALRMSQESYTYYQQSQPTITASGRGAMALREIAECQYALGQVHLAIANLQEAIRLRMWAMGQQDLTAREWLLRIEDWFLDQGQPNCADEVRATREKISDLTELD